VREKHGTLSERSVKRERSLVMIEVHYPSSLEIRRWGGASRGEREISEGN